MSRYALCWVLWGYNGVLVPILCGGTREYHCSISKMILEFFFAFRIFTVFCISAFIRNVWRQRKPLSIPGFVATLRHHHLLTNLLSLQSRISRLRANLNKWCWDTWPIHSRKNRFRNCRYAFYEFCFKNNESHICFCFVYICYILQNRIHSRNSTPMVTGMFFLSICISGSCWIINIYKSMFYLSTAPSPLMSCQQL